MNYLDEFKEMFQEYDSIVENGSFLEILHKDVLNYLCFLSKGDQSISDKEVDFLNQTFHQSWCKREYEEYMRNTSIDKKYTVENTNVFFTISGAVFGNNVDKDTGIEMLHTLLTAFRMLGTEFLSCDDKVNDKEVKRYSKFIIEANQKVQQIIQWIYEDEDGDIIPSIEKEEAKDTLEDVLEEFNSLVGLAGVKEEIYNLVNYVKIRNVRVDRGLQVLPMSYHLCFTGNPGTGKTTVARLLARIYHHLGILSEGKLTEVSRADLVGGYIGQTAIKTKEVIESSLGGVLFIDEAYSLTFQKGELDYGREAIETLLKYMEDHRDNFIVIFAGYTAPMEEFIATNPGLESRIHSFIEFDDYSEEELYEIFTRLCEKNSYTVDEDAQKRVQEIFSCGLGNKNEAFGNARFVRNVFEHAIMQQANRLAMDPDLTDAELMELTIDDFN